MSAPAAERQVGFAQDKEVFQGFHAKPEIIGHVAIGPEALADKRPSLETPKEVEAFLANFIARQKLKLEATNVYRLPNGEELRAAKITSDEELVYAELPEPDEALGATGLLIDAEKPFSDPNKSVVRVAVTRYTEDGTLVVDRITDPEMKGYATARVADIVSAVANQSIEPSETSAFKPFSGLHEQSLKLNSAAHKRHAKLEL